MEIEEAIDTYLKSISDLTDVIPIQSIGWIDKRESTEYPRLVFRNISNPKLYEMPDRWQRWRFYILAEDSYTCKAVARILDTNLEALYGNMGGLTMSYVTKLNFPDPEFDEDRQKYMITMDYRFSFIKT
jgi:hypothetical protein